MVNIKIEEDEIWISYIKRCLEAEGVGVSEYRVGDLPDDESLLSVLVDTRETADTISIDLETALHIATDKQPIQYSKLCEVKEEYIVVRWDDEKCMRFDIDRKGNVQVLLLDKNDKRLEGCELPEKLGILGKYKAGEIYSAQNVINDIVQIAKTLNTTKPETMDMKNGHREAIGVSRGCTSERNETGLESIRGGEEIMYTLKELLRGVKNLERIAANHPVVLKQDDVYLRELYTTKINEDPGNLCSFEHDGHKINYIVVHSSDIEGKTGRQSHNLFFVARDKAPKEWQEKIVAWHEYWESKVGHDEARKKEPELAKALGKEKEYAKWTRKLPSVAI